MINIKKGMEIKTKVYQHKIASIDNMFQYYLCNPSLARVILKDTWMRDDYFLNLCLLCL